MINERMKWEDSTSIDTVFANSNVFLESGAPKDYSTVLY